MSSDLGDQYRFVPFEKADQENLETVFIGGEFRAYPGRFLSWHEPNT